MTSGKAWRFEGEMLEISETYSDLGLPELSSCRSLRAHGLLERSATTRTETVVAAIVRGADQWT